MFWTDSIHTFSDKVNLATGHCQSIGHRPWRERELAASLQLLALVLMMSFLGALFSSEGDNLILNKMASKIIFTEVEKNKFWR